MTRILRSFFAAAAAAVFSVGVAAQSSGFDASLMDRSVAPCNDFYQYANGEWLRTTEIPASEARWGTFNILSERNNVILREILEAAAKKPGAKGSDTQLIGDFYATCMDEAAIERNGTRPIDQTLKRIAGMKTAADVQRQIAWMHANGVPAVFSFGVGADLKDAEAVILNGFQGGLSLPNRDYYSNTDERSVETREKFVEYVTNMFKLLGDSESAAAANAATVMRLQTRLAGASLAPVELRNPDNRYNKISFEEAQKLTPDFEWKRYLEGRGIKGETEANIAPAKFFEEVNAMVKDVPVADWQTYLRWMTVNSAAPFLPKRFADENFNFFGRYLSGQQERQPRWRTCVQNTNGNLGEALGMEYARRQFKPEAKARMNELIDNLMAAMEDRINNLEWMSADTKKEAQTKLSTFKRKIGYPDVLRGYKGLEITRRSYAENQQASARFQINRSLEDLGKPRDKTRWGFTPSTVNASYSPLNNEITFPAGILQPPFFNFEADDAINYGAIGGVIGHEITHGFDDQGSRFDAEGNLRMWWTAEDRQKFDERAACLVKQWDGYEVQPGLFMVGKLALGENIGDFAGLTVAYDAFQRSLKGKPRPANIDGFTPEQRFFLGWARVWASKYTPEAEIAQVRNGPHSLPKWRVLGPLSNMPQFKQAFGCKAGDPMVRETPCSIW
ncbi:MAG TPA: M13 family metallopeptidase [Pyrinomonadaceae bacterium]|nr:M13 family metallopeptidase [Pyrinomonadaceae bacterium]HMP64454.1 M13 family metallopeptidase [Pyrinomonadaceae bacterium]